MEGGGGVRCQTFIFYVFSLSSRPPAGGVITVKSSFFGLATNALNVRNNSNNNNSLDDYDNNPSPVIV